MAVETVRQALDWARQTLANVPESEPLDAYVLLEAVLGCDRAALLAHPERPLGSAEVSRYRDAVGRRAQGEPIAYLIGRRAFYDLPYDLIVTPDVLIPRPETEHLVEAALAWGRGRRRLRAVDVGTGSGAIAVALGWHWPDAEIWAVDRSAAALGVARRNIARHALSARVHTLQGDLLAPLLERGSVADVIAANLPYIPSAELAALSVARHEPRLALDGGADGLALFRRLLAQAPAVLSADGAAFLEIGAGQGEAVRALAQAAFPRARVDVLPDLAGRGRVVRIVRGEREHAPGHPR